MRRRLEESIEVSIATTPLDIVVMGPNFDTNSEGGKLRERIIKAAEKYGTSVKPEHRGIIDLSKKKLGAGHNLTHMELQLVDVSDLVVLIPDSPGSLCELGFFSTIPGCTRKMIILLSNAYPPSGSYVTEGPVAAAKHQGAQAERVDYTNIEACWKLVREKIEKVRSNKVLEKKMMGLR